MEGDAQARGVEHRQIVGPVADGDHLLEPEALLSASSRSSSALRCPVHDRAAHLAGAACRLDLELVREDVIDAEPLLQVLTEVA